MKRTVGARLIEAMREAVAISRGEAEPAREHVVRLHPYSGAPMRAFAFQCGNKSCPFSEWKDKRRIPSVRRYWLTWNQYAHMHVAPHNCPCGSRRYRMPATWGHDLPLPESPMGGNA